MLNIAGFVINAITLDSAKSSTTQVTTDVCLCTDTASLVFTGVFSNLKHITKTLACSVS